VLDEQEQGDAARSRQSEGNDDRDAGYCAGGAGVDAAQREDGEAERGGEDRDGDLIPSIFEQRAHDPRRELPHRELHG
jgi:hypothetical protein